MVLKASEVLDLNYGTLYHATENLPKIWKTLFLCLLSLSSFLGKLIQLCYPNNGIYKYKVVFFNLTALITYHEILLSSLYKNRKISF